MAEGADGVARQCLGRVLAWELAVPHGHLLPCAGSPWPLPDLKSLGDGRTKVSPGFALVLQ